MSAVRALVFLLALLAVLAITTATTAADAPGGLRVEPETVETGIVGRGETIRATASVPPGARAIFRLVGPQERLRVKRRGRVGGVVWAAVDETTFEGVPAALLVIGWPRPPSERTLRVHAMDRSAIARRLLPENPTPADRLDVRDLLEAKEIAGLYRTSASARTTEDGRALAEFELPADASAGSYEVTLHVLTGDEVVATDRHRVVVRRGGAVTTVSGLARDAGLLYGLVAVLLALGVGLAAGLLRGLGSRIA